MSFLFSYKQNINNSLENFYSKKYMLITGFSGSGKSSCSIKFKRMIANMENTYIIELDDIIHNYKLDSDDIDKNGIIWRFFTSDIGKNYRVNTEKQYEEKIKLNKTYERDLTNNFIDFVKYIAPNETNQYIINGYQIYMHYKYNLEDPLIIMKKSYISSLISAIIRDYKYGDKNIFEVLKYYIKYRLKYMKIENKAMNIFIWNIEDCINYKFE